MTKERIRITLPRAKEYGNGNVGTRQYDLKIFVKNPFEYVNLTGIHYSPSFARVQVDVMRGGLELETVHGSEGKIDIQHSTDQFEPMHIRLYNLDIDTDVKYTLYLHGEMMRL